MKGITDMWASLNVSSRLEAAEAGIAKLSSLMQDLIGKDISLPKLVYCSLYIHFILFL